MSERRGLRRSAGAVLAATVVATAVVAGAGPSSAAVVATHPLVPADLATTDAGLYGWTGVIDGSTAVVTAHLQDAGGPDAGAAYVFTRTAGSWTEQSKFTGGAGDHFGRGAGLDGDLLALGAPGPDDTGVGEVVVYTRAGAGPFAEQATLAVPDLVGGDIFGYEVAVQDGSPGTIVVAARGDDADRGAVYVYTGAGPTWTLQATLRASDGAAGDEFGKAVALDGDLIVVGADMDDNPTSSAGSAYVFRRTAGIWSEEALLTAGADTQINNRFGFSVDIQGQRIVVGARLADAGADNQAGAAHVFTTAGGGAWTQEQRLTASDASPDDRFGTSVAIDGGLIAVGAPERDGATGRVYAFALAGGVWGETDQVTDATPVAGGRLGWRVGVSGDSLLVGAPDFPPPATRGKAWVVDLTPGTNPVAPPPPPPPPTTEPPPAAPPAARADGYWIVTAGGDVAAFGTAPDLGDAPVAPGDRAVAIAATPDGAGWWVATAAGRVTARGNAAAYGDASALPLNAPVVGLAAAPDGRGYWLLGADGGVFSFGPGAPFFGSTGGRRLNQPVVGMAAEPSGRGYWFVAADGGVFSFGPGARFAGSTGGRVLNQPVVGMAATAQGGYRLVARDGGVFTFGPGATFYGSTGGRRLVEPVVGMAGVVGGEGYRLIAADGGVFDFGPDARFAGSLSGRAATPAVGLA